MGVATQLLGKLYRPQSELVWNGNRIVTLAGIGEFFSKMPPSRHDIQSVDCHPIAGMSTANATRSNGTHVNSSGCAQEHRHHASCAQLPALSMSSHHPNSPPNPSPPRPLRTTSLHHP